MRWRLYVEGQELDGGDKFSAQFTYAIDDIKDFGFRNSPYSKTIILPGTGRNNQIFGHVFEVSNGNFHNASNPNVGYNYNAAKVANCYVTDDTFTIFKGALRILEIIIDGDTIEYEVSVVGELGGLVAAIGDNLLEDLDFSAYDHALTVTNIQNSWAGTPGSGYYYPLIDYGYTLTGRTYPIENFRPSFYAKEYIDKIFEEAGYTYESTFLNGDFFNKLIIPFNGIYPTKEVANILHMTGATDDGGVVTFDTVVGDAYMAVLSFNHFIWKRKEKVQAKFTFSCNYTSSGGVTGLAVLVYKNGLFTAEVAGSQNTSASGSISFENIVEMEEGDYFQVYAQPIGVLGANTLTSIDFKITGNPAIRIPLSYQDDVVCNDMIPKNIKQKDFLAWIIKMFNLYLDEDNIIEKHLRIEPFVDFYDPVNRLNWDEKLDRNQAIRLKPMGELNARMYEFKYKDDTDYFNDLYKKKYGVSYGSVTFDSGFEYVRDKQTIEVGFSPTPLAGHDGVDRVVSAIYKKSETSMERSASNIRILLRTASNITCKPWKIQYYASEDTLFLSNETFTTYPYAGHLDDPDAPTVDINWGAPYEFYFVIVSGYLSANLFNVYWSFYISEITDKDSKVFSGHFRLTPIDIYNLDFSKLIYLRGALWRLSSVNDYSTDQPDTTKCDLLKVIDVV